MTAASVVNSLEYFKKRRRPAGRLPGRPDVSQGDRRGHGPADASPLPSRTCRSCCPSTRTSARSSARQGLASPSTLTTTSDGTGPYVLSAAQSVANSQYVFTLNPHYWNPAAVHYKQVVVKVMTDPQTALVRRPVGPGRRAAQPAVHRRSSLGEERPASATFAQPFSIASLILMGRSDPKSPLSNLKVRQAINDAVDRAVARRRASAAAAPCRPTSSRCPAPPATTRRTPAPTRSTSRRPRACSTQAGYGSGFKLDVLDTLALDAERRHRRRAQDRARAPSAST